MFENKAAISEELSKQLVMKKTEEVKQRWTKALTDVAYIAGEHYLNWFVLFSFGSMN